MLHKIQVVKNMRHTVFTEKQVAVEDVGCWEKGKKRISAEHFINYCFFPYLWLHLQFFNNLLSLLLLYSSDAEMSRDNIQI